MPEFAPCPKCAGTTAKQVKFTWWGGALGPRMFHHVKCEACGATYNGRTGKSNNHAIAMYVLVTFTIVAVAAYALAAGR